MYAKEFQELKKDPKAFRDTKNLAYEFSKI